MFSSNTQHGRSGHGPIIPQPQPRSLEQLRTERSYLLNSLQRENDKATSLLNKLPRLEEILALSLISQFRRRVRKKIGWLRYRINETTRQERAVLNSLGELAHEIAERERWEVEFGRESRWHGRGFGEEAMGMCQQIQQLSFSPLTPLPLQEYPFPYMYSPLQPQYESRGFPWQHLVETSEMPEEIFGPVGEQEGAGSLGFGVATESDVNTTKEECKEGRRRSSMSNVDGELMKTHTPPVIVSAYKRHSTGGERVPKIWSDERQEEVEEREESVQGSRYEGFYIDGRSRRVYSSCDRAK